MRRPRGFTLIEMALAVSLGVLVIAVALGVFGAMRRGWDRSQERNRAAIEMSRLRVSLQEAFRGVIVLPKQRSAGRAVVAGSAGGATVPAVPAGGVGTPTGLDGKPLPAPGAPATGAVPARGAGGRPEPGRARSGTPALPAGVEAAANLGGDDAGPGLAGGGSSVPRLILETLPTGEQRLEMVVARSPTIAAAADRSWTLGTAESGGGIRGGFELRPSLDGAGYDIWWRTYPVDQGPDQPRLPLGEARIARGFVKLRWTFVKSDANRQMQWLTAASATDASELPAYVELEAENRLGQKARWMFEIGWIVARAQDAVADVPDEVADRLSGIDLVTGQPRADAGGGRGPGGKADGPPVPGEAPRTVGGGGRYDWRVSASGQALDAALRPGRTPWAGVFGPDGRPIR